MQSENETENAARQIKTKKNQLRGQSLGTRSSLELFWIQKFCRLTLILRDGVITVNDILSIFITYTNNLLSLYAYIY